MKRIIRAKNRILSRICEHPREGDGTVNVLITIIIAVVVAGIVIGLISASMPELWASLMSKISSLFS